MATISRVLTWFAANSSKLARTCIREPPLLGFTRILLAGAKFRSPNQPLRPNSPETRKCRLAFTCWSWSNAPGLDRHAIAAPGESNSPKLSDSQIHPKIIKQHSSLSLCKSNNNSFVTILPQLGKKFPKSTLPRRQIQARERATLMGAQVFKILRKFH